jgi:hypothetical protein
MGVNGCGQFLLGGAQDSLSSPVRLVVAHPSQVRRSSRSRVPRLDPTHCTRTRHHRQTLQRLASEPSCRATAFAVTLVPHMPPPQGVELDFDGVALTNGAEVPHHGVVEELWTGRCEKVVLNRAGSPLPSAERWNSHTCRGKKRLSA